MVIPKLAGARRALHRFCEINQCPHCCGLTEAAWKLAYEYVSEEGLATRELPRFKTCPGTCGTPERYDADTLESIIRGLHAGELAALVEAATNAGRAA